MRVRFSIRDLLWLTLVVALASAWWIERRQVIELRDQLTILRGVSYLHNIQVTPLNAARSNPRFLGDESIEKAMQIDAIRSQGNVPNFEAEPQIIEQHIEFAPAK